MEKNLHEAIQHHIRDCKAAVDEAVSSSIYTSLDVKNRLMELDRAREMEKNPQLFFEHQRVLYFNASI